MDARDESGSPEPVVPPAARHRVPAGQPHQVPDPEPDPDVVDRHALERAKAGDDHSFAELVRGHDPDLHALVSFLVDPDHVDEVLRIAYVKAYRSLPRLRDDRPPRLWLHQTVLLAVVDELRRRSRRRGDPLARRTAAKVRRTEPSGDDEGPRPTDETRSPHASSGITVLGPGEAPAAATSGQPTDEEPAEGGAEATDRPELLAALDLVPSEQRIAVALVDGVALTPDEAATVADCAPAALNTRLAKGRKALRSSLAMAEPDDEATGADLAERFDATLVSPHDEGFWHEVGQHLLAARAAPAPAAAPVPEHAARRAAATVPPAPSARPKPAGVDPEAVRDLAGQARRRRTRDIGAWRRIVLGIGALAILAALVIGGFVLSSRISHRDSQLGVTSAKVISQIDDALEGDAAVSGTATVSGARTTVPSGSYNFVRAPDGSYAVSSTSPAWNEAYDAARGTFALYHSASGAAPTALEATGLPAGAPDLPPVVGLGLGDPLASAVRLLREGKNITLTTLGNNGSPQWVIDEDLPSGIDYQRGVVPGVGSFTDPTGADHVRVTFDQSLRLPTQVQFTKQTVLVSTVTFTGLEIANQRPADAFAVTFPGGTPVSQQNFGFQATGGTATGPSRVTPSYLPTGFTLAVVTTREDQPPGSGSTAAGTNPPTQGAVSYAYRHGSALVVITVRNAATPAGTRWTDPFSTATIPPAGTKVHLSDGLFFGTDAFRGDEPLTHLWGLNDRLVFTVAGDVSSDDLVKIAASLH